MSKPETEKILNSQDGYYLKKMIEAYEQSAQRIAELEAEPLKERQDSYLLREDVKQLQLQIKRCQDIAEKDGKDYAELLKKIKKET